jgi:hypothetical protein
MCDSGHSQRIGGELLQRREHPREAVVLNLGDRRTQRRGPGRWRQRSTCACEKTASRRKNVRGLSSADTSINRGSIYFVPELSGLSGERVHVAFMSARSPVTHQQ